jgi:hypothetical protein
MSVGKIPRKFTDGNIPSVFPFVFICFLVVQQREGHEGGRLIVSSKTARLEFPRFSGDDPTEWFNRVN